MISSKIKLLFAKRPVQVFPLNHYIRFDFNDLILIIFNPLSANPTKWSNTLKQFVGKLLTNCLRVFDYFLVLVLKDLSTKIMFRDCGKSSFQPKIT